MKGASPALTAFLLNIQDRVPGTPASFYAEDLYTVVLGNGFIVVRQRFTPVGGIVQVNAPPVGTGAGFFVADLGVTYIDYTPLTPGTVGPFGYTVNVSNGVGVYHFADNTVKLISYAFGIGIIPPVLQFWTSGAFPLLWAGNTYSAAGPFLNRSMIKSSVGLTVDSVEIELAATPSMSFPEPIVPLLQAMVQGYFDGAAVLVQRIIMPNYGNMSLGTVIQFKGTVADVTEVSRVGAKFEVRSRLELLNQPLPRNLYQPSCRHTLYDIGCTLKQTAFTFATTVVAGSNKSVINTPLTQPARTPGPTNAPTLSISVPPRGVNLTERNEFVVITYVNSLGESLSSPEAISTFGVVTSIFAVQPGSGYISVPRVTISGGGGSGAKATAILSNGQIAGFNLTAIGSGYTSPPTVTIDAPPLGGTQATALTSIQGIPSIALVVVHSPPPGPAGTIGWNCYIGTAPGDEMLQNATPIPIGQNYTEPTTGAVQGSPPPLLATNGYFSQGVVAFTSGPNMGLSRVITLHLNGGVLNIIPPLPFTPLVGDNISVSAGCDKRSSTCNLKFQNLIHFGGMPYIPDPSLAL
jgi:hypothetical protein